MYQGNLHREETRGWEKCIQKRMAYEFIECGKGVDELLILRELQHKNVFEYIDGFIVDQGVSYDGSLYTEYCEHETCKTIWTQRWRYKMPGFANWDLLKQLANAVGYLQNGIHDVVSATSPITGPTPGWRVVAHCDIGPWNIFLRSGGDGNNETFPHVVLGDFGLAKRADRNTTVDLGADTTSSLAVNADDSSRSNEADDSWNRIR